jgi:hypothetical protein
LTQLLAAAEQPAALRCIAPAQTAGDLFSGWFYHQGAYRLASSVGWALQMLRGDARKRRIRSASGQLEDAATRLPALLASGPYSRIACLTARGLPTYHRDWTSHRQAGPWWSRHDVSTRMDRIQIPALHLWGWFDTYLDGSEQLYQGLLRESKAPQYLVAGPWNHIPWSRYSGEVDHGKLGQSTLSETERAQGYALLCQAEARSDLVIECRDVTTAADFPVKILPSRVQHMALVAPDVMQIQLRLPANERLQFRAGQYIDILLKDGSRRSLSLAHAPHDDALLELHLRNYGGTFSNYVFNSLKIKDILRFQMFKIILISF